MESQDIFQRFEKKYKLSGQQYLRLQTLLRGEMAMDAYGLHTISSLYFDTDSFAIIRASVQGPQFKEKLRLRWYGIPKPEDPVFLELKRKFRGIVYKRRVSVKAATASRLVQAGLTVPPDGQIGKEVDWFVRRYQPQPRILLSYDREALQSLRYEGLRITFDHSIRWRDSDFEPSHGSYGEALLEEDTVLMEIKACGNLPIWLADLLAAEKIYPSSFSKYGTWYEQVYLQKGIKLYVG